MSANYFVGVQGAFPGWTVLFARREPGSGLCKVRGEEAEGVISVRAGAGRIPVFERIAFPTLDSYVMDSIILPVGLLALAGVC